MTETAEWPNDASQYELSGKIGQGAFASVWRAKRSLINSNNNLEDKAESTLKEQQQQQHCAIKVLNLDHVDSNLTEIRQEVQTLRLSSHPNILVCHAAFVQATDLWLVTQLMRKGSSLHCLQHARKYYRAQEQPCVPMEDHILYILHETLLGLQYIHDNGQIHRDIKAGNILIDSDGKVRIADFGVSGWLVQAGTQQEKAKTFVGTPCWMAPEVMEQIHGYDYKADIWSLGITALELAKGYAPYAKYPPMKVLILTIQRDPPTLDTYDEEDGLEDDHVQAELEVNEEFTKSFSQFIDKCLQKNPAKRLKSQELLSSKFMSGLQDAANLQARRQALVDQVCSKVEDVGSTDEVDEQALPGDAPVSIVLSQETTQRPAGTTWVFADGSQVLATSAATATVDDVLDEMVQFGQETGGEHYNKESSRSGTPVETTSSTGTANTHTEPDDLNAFMDEFELNTQGENFRREG